MLESFPYLGLSALGRIEASPSWQSVITHRLSIWKVSLEGAPEGPVSDPPTPSPAALTLVWGHDLFLPTPAWL